MTDFTNKEIDQLIKDYTNDLPEDHIPSGAMVCDYNTFKSIYQLNARASIRHDNQVVVGMVKIIDFQGSAQMSPDEKTALFNKVGATLASSLRRDDVITGFDTSQYLMMLFNITMDNAVMVLKRLLTRIEDEIDEEIVFETKLETINAPNTQEPFKGDPENKEK